MELFHNSLLLEHPNGFLITDDKDLILVDQNNPTTYQEAIENQESKKWLRAMDSEMQSMYDNQVWTLVDLPEGGKQLLQVGFQIKSWWNLEGTTCSKRF